MRTFTRFWLFALMTFFASSVIAQQAAIQQTGTSRPDKMELIQQLHGPTMQVAKQMEGQTRAEGDDCTDPFSVTYGNLPYADNNQTTENRGNTYSSTCLNDFDGGEDIVYELDLSQDATLIFNLDPKVTAHS
nr:hypothetical protein [Bacteroidota bacterium]